MKILLVDDNADSIKLTARLLEIQGHHARAVHSGEDALKLAEEGWDLILLDIDMGEGIDGWDTCRRFRQIPETADAFIMAVTGRDQPDDFLRSARAGFNHHHVKPLYGTEELWTVYRERGAG
jgi:CheY-like chemotaxis protein